MNYKYIKLFFFIFFFFSWIYLLSGDVSMAEELNPSVTPTPENQENPEYDRFVCFINGGTVKYDKTKINYKTCEWKVSLTPSAIVTENSKGECSAKKGKIITAVTVDNQKPVVINGKVEKDTEASNIAKASFKNNKVTVTAGKQPGKVYVWVLDTGDAQAYLCKEFYVDYAPSKIEAYLDEDCTVKYTPQRIPIGKTIKVYLKGYTKDETRPSSSFDIYCDEKTEKSKKDYIDVEVEYFYDETQERTIYDAVVTIKAKSINPDKDGKAYKENIQIAEHLSNKKIKLAVTVVNPLIDVDLYTDNGPLFNSLENANNNVVMGENGPENNNTENNNAEKVLTLTVNKDKPFSAVYKFLEITSGNFKPTTKTKMYVCDSLSDVAVDENKGTVKVTKASGEAKNLKTVLKNNKLSFVAKSGKISSEFDFYLIFVTEKGFDYQAIKVSVKFENKNEE